MKPFTLATPRYAIENSKGDNLDIFRRRANAIKAAIKLAVEYPGTTFVVVKKVFRKKKVIFSFRIDAQLDFDDVQDFYRSIIEVYQKKFNKTRYWRKSDGSSD